MNQPNVVQQQLELLLSAHGYNLYNSANRARADDLLVRQRASAALGSAANRLTELASNYARRCIPPSTREQPYPPADKLATLKQLQELAAQASTVATRIRGMAAPAQDRVWSRFRDEADTLQHLLNFDYHLIRDADAFEERLEPLTAETWDPAHAADLRALLQAVEQDARERERFLNTPIY